jgi:hypothetical protein
VASSPLDGICVSGAEASAGDRVSCQVHSEDAYYGHLVVRLMASFVWFYTSRVVCKGRLTMEEIIFSLKHYWRFVDMEPLELQALS